MLNTQIRAICRVTKGVNEMTDESILRLFGHIIRMGGIGLLKGCMWKSEWLSISKITEKMD